MMHFCTIKSFVASQCDIQIWNIFIQLIHLWIWHEHDVDNNMLRKLNDAVM
jgi:hypothetical protein